ncbi:MAG: hypothetical protein ACTSPA_07545 [Promethearchaeota archaeon]
MNDLLTITEEQEQFIQKMLDETKKDFNFPDYSVEDGETREIIYVPVDDGEIRVIHVNPKNKISKRPLVFVPGWGVIPRNFDDFYEVLHEKIEFFYIETREKKTSRIKRFKAKLTMNQKAKDVGDALNFLGLNGDKDFVLMGPCWGGAVILQGLMDKTIKAPTIVAVDPMHRLWYPQWMLDYVGPILPVWLLHLMKPLLKWLKLRNMKEKVQKQRAEDLIKEAEMWKWKRAGFQCRHFELYGNLYKIDEEVFVFNATNDLIHDKRDYPKIAKEIPKGRFIYMETYESYRERIREFSKISSSEGIPSKFKEFEIKIH